VRRYFTHYWQNSAKEFNKRGRPLDYALGSMFISRGVRLGDVIFVVTVENGILHLIGRMVVGGIVDRIFAVRLRGRDDLWDSPECVIARKRTASPMRFDRVLPIRWVKRLRFKGSRGTVALLMRQEKLDRQTLRGVRELTKKSAEILEGVIKRSERKGFPKG
jgi:hypothetical protein